MDSKQLLKRVQEDSVKFISLQFSDVTGAVKSVDMPVAAAGGRAGRRRLVRRFLRGRLCPHPGKRYAARSWIPIRMPSCRGPRRDVRRARIFCDIYSAQGEPFEGDPRGTLKRVLAKIDGARLDLQRRPGAGILPVQGRQRQRAVPHSA